MYKKATDIYANKSYFGRIDTKIRKRAMGNRLKLQNIAISVFT
jgi:hypothetical protein